MISWQEYKAGKAKAAAERKESEQQGQQAVHDLKDSASRLHALYEAPDHEAGEELVLHAYTLIKGLAALLELPRVALEAMEASSWLPTVEAALGVVYTLEDEGLIRAVMQLWEAVTGWLLQQESLDYPPAGLSEGGAESATLAATCLLELLVHGPLPALIESERVYLAAISQSAQTASSNLPVPPPALCLHPHTSQPATPCDNMHTGGVPSTDQPHTPYHIQCYQLMLHVLQHNTFDDLDWDTQLHAPAAAGLLVQCFTACGGSAQSLQACVLATLHPLATALLPSKHTTSKGNKRLKTSAVTPTTLMDAAGSSGGGTSAATSALQQQQDSVVGLEPSSSTHHVGDPLLLLTTQVQLQQQAGPDQATSVRKTHDWIWSQAGARVVQVLALTPDIPLLISCLLTVTGASHDKTAGSAVLDLVQLMFSCHHVRQLLEVCVEVLRPEANCAIDIRVMAMTAMYTAVYKHLDSLCLQAGSHGDGTAGGDVTDGKPASTTGPHPAPRVAAQQAVWSEYAVGVVLFSGMHDPSAKVRRCVLKLMFTMPLASCTQLSKRCVHVLVSRTRDKDDVCQKQATLLLMQLPPELLVSVGCSTAEWLWLLRCALQLMATHKEVVSGVRRLLQHVAHVSSRPSSHPSLLPHPVQQLVMVAAEQRGTDGHVLLQRASTFLKEALA